MGEAPSSSFGAHLKRGFATWVSVDVRAAGLFHIGLGLLCAIDVFRRLEYVEVFYSNVGVLSNHFNLYRPFTQHNLSLLNALSRPGEVYVFFWATLISALCLMIGYRTRLFQILTTIGILSIHSRNVMLENGGDVVLNLWLLWTFFLPLGERFSVDALRRSLRGRVEKTSADLAAPFERPRQRVWSIAMFAVLCQLGVIYFFNTVHKSGAAWADGSAIAWVIEQDRIVRPAGVFMRDHLPFWVGQMLSWGTLVIEGMAPLLLFSPIFTVWTRRLAILTLSGLHLGIYLVTDVGLFSWDMMVAYPLLLTAPDFVALRRILRRLSGAPVTVFYDSDCGVCHLCARVGARLDRLGLITWAGHDLERGPPPGYDAAQFAETRQNTLLAWDEASGRTWVRHRAVARTIAALPGGRLIAWIAWVPGLSALFGVAYDRFAARRQAISAWMGLGVCGIDPPGTPVAVSALPPSDARRQLRRVGWVLSQVIMIYFMVVAVTQVLIENRAIRKYIKAEQPAWARATVQYGRWYQGWGMFAPNVPQRDGWIAIDAELTDGRRLDPQTGEAPYLGTADHTRMKWDQFWGSYSMRIASKSRSAFRGELRKWLKRRGIRHLKLGPEDQIKAFTVWWIGDRSPDPRVGGPPKEFERYKITEWPTGRSK